MCSVTNGTVTLCMWGKASRSRREIVPLLLTTDMKPTEIASNLGRRPDGTRVHAVQVRRVRLGAEQHGCLKRRTKTCPDCPPDKPTRTPLGGRCSPCQERHQAVDQQRYRSRESSGIPARTAGFLPPPPPELRTFPLGTVYFAPRQPSRVELPAIEPRTSVEIRVPSFSRARCEVDAWSRPANPMMGA